MTRLLRSTDRRLTTGWIIVGIIVFGVTVLGAGLQPASAAGPSMTVTEAVEAALQNHDTIRLAELQKASAAAEAKGTMANVRPQLSLKVSGNRFDGPLSQMQIPDGTLDEVTGTLTLRTPVLPSQLARATRTLAQHQAAGGQAAWTQAVEGVILESVGAYYDVLLAEMRSEAVDAELQVSAGKLEQAEWKKTAGTATVADVLQAKAELAGVQARQAQADGDLQAARIKLNQVMGEPIGTPVDVVDNHTALSGALAELVAEGKSGKPASLAKAESDQVQSKAAYVIAREINKPKIQVFGRVMRNEFRVDLGVDRNGYLSGSLSDTRRYLNETEIPADEESWTAGFEVEWSFLDWGARRAKVDQARDSLEMADVGVEASEKKVEADQKAADARLEAATMALEATEKALAAVQESAKVVGQLRDQGAATDLQVLEARNGAMQASVTRMESVKGAILAQLDYLRTHGVLLDAWQRIRGDLLEPAAGRN